MGTAKGRGRLSERLGVDRGAHSLAAQPRSRGAEGAARQRQLG